MNITEGAVFTREIKKIVWANKLTVAASELDNVNPYAVEDFLHQNLITFPNVFLNSERGLSTLVRIHAKAYGSPIFLPDFRIALFNKNECDIAPVMNNAFNWGTVCKGEHVLQYIDVIGAEFKGQAHNPGGGPATNYYEYTGANLNLVLDNEVLNAAIARSNDLVGVLICKTIGQFNAGGWLKVGMEIVHQ